jgi:hypothetical protein
MAKLLTTKSIYLNDIVLIAQVGKVKSRKDVPVELNRIIVAPMTSVVGETFAEKATSLGLSVTIPRFFGIEREINIYNSCKVKENLYGSIGLNDINRINAFSNAGCKNFLLDVASGYLPQIKDTVKLLHENTAVDKLILGNIHTLDGAKYLTEIVRSFEKFKNTILIYRVGISNGCFIPTSTIKTISGLKEIQNIDIGEFVLTHTGNYRKVINKYKYSKKENLIKINNNITCTSEHKFYVIHKDNINKINDTNYKEYAEWIPANKLNKNYFFIKL